MKSHWVVALLLFFVSTALFSQNGNISGTVSDAKDGLSIPSVHVILMGGTKKQQLTDLDGNFQFANLPAGTYQLTLKFADYDSITRTGIVLKAGETVTLNFQMTPKINDLGVVNIVGKIDRSGTSGMINEQKNNASVSDVMSSEDMKTKPDTKVSETLKRVSGASVVDNKFVVIRGLSDRYNFALLNGAPLPSSESDKKAFSFDIFPSNMLDNLIITKSASPDLPGEFAGGVININTVAPKDSGFHRIQIGTSVNTISTFRNFASYEGGKTDFLGFGTSSRDLPSNVPSIQGFNELKNADKASLAKAFTPSWSTTNRMALPALSLQYGYGHNFKFKKRTLGMVAAYSYSNNFQANETIRREFEEEATQVVQRTELRDSVFTQSVMNTGMLNFSMNLNERNKLQFFNMFSVTSDDRVNVRKGVREMDQLAKQWEKSTNFWYTQNNLYTSQLTGTHTVGKAMKFNWTGGFSDVTRSIPNLRRVVYQKTAENEDDPNESYYAVVQNNGTIPTAAGNMFWSTTKEQIYSAKYDFVIPVEHKKLKIEYKVGGFNQFRTRQFDARNFGFSRYKPANSQFNSELLGLSPDQIFSIENLGTLSDGRGGFKIDEATKVSDSYQAQSFLNAGFAMIDSRLSEKMRIVTGIRVESYNQKFSYIEAGTNAAKKIDTTVVDLLPSLNVIYSINKKTNLRASYYRSVSRPEFRELAPFAFYNFTMDNILSGNTNLQRATIDNYDLRFETFPGSGQIFSVSAFYKNFNNPIELINRTGTSGAPELYYTNIGRVSNIGAEIEYRLNLDVFKKKPSSEAGGNQREKENLFLDNTTLYTNFSYIKSTVYLDSIVGSGGNRPLQGQSPYIVNAGLSFAHPTKHWTASLNYNVVGQRIYIVGNVQEPSVWENGRHVIDMQITKTIKERIDIKFNVKDLLAQKLLFFQDLDGDMKYTDGVDNRWQEVTFGRTISLSIGYRFK